MHEKYRKKTLNGNTRSRYFRFYMTLITLSFSIYLGMSHFSVFKSYRQKKILHIETLSGNYRNWVESYH